jgi:hypothetical protein
MRSQNRISPVEVVAVLVLLFGGARQADAVVIYDTFNIGDFIGPGGNPIGKFPLGGNFDFAMQFELTNNYILDKIEVDVYLTEGPDILDMWIMDDNGGFPGTIIDSMQIVDQAAPFPGSVVMSPSSSNPLLSGGDPYWVALSTPDPDSYYAWISNADDARTQVKASQIGSAGWNYGIAVTGNPQPFTKFPNRYRLQGSRVPSSPVIPEPATFLLFGLGMLGSAFLHKKH